MTTKSQINASLAGTALSELGFQDASKTDIHRILTQIEPTGGNAFRDALIGGCDMLIKIHQLLQETSQAETWSLVQVILTDGDDAGSKTQLMEAVKVMQTIGQLANVKMLKVIFIGVGVSGKAEQEMRLLAKSGGENAEYYSAGDANIASVFRKITANLGLENRQNISGVANSQASALLAHQEINPSLAIQRHNYAVMFNLDVTGSMSGSKWNSVCQSVARFTNFLGEGDIIAASVFNHQAKLLTKRSANDELSGRRAPSPPRHYQAVAQRQQLPQEQELRRGEDKTCYCQLI